MLLKKLIEARKASGFTQATLCEKISMEQTTYSRKENGRSPMTEAEWIRIAKALSVKVDDIKEIVQVDSSINDNYTAVNNPKEVEQVSILKSSYDTMIKYIAKLEEQNATLKAQIASDKK